MAGEAPLRHDRAAARDNAGDAVGGERHIGEPHAGVDGEVVDALFALLDERVLVALPVELDRVAVDLLQRLVDRHGADRHRRIADDPFAGVVDVAAGGEVHHGVGAPADRPHHLLDLFLDRRRDGGVADIGVDLGEEVAADDHRLEFGVVDVRRDDGAAARDFAAHEFRRDEQRHRGAEALAVLLRPFGAVELLLPPEVLALGDVDHLLGDDAGLRPFVLRHRLAGQRTQRPVHGREGAGEVLARDVAVVDRLDRPAVVFLDAAALLHPFGARALEALLDVDRDIVVGVGAGGVVDRQVRLVRALAQHDLAHRHAQVGRSVGLGVDLARGGEGARRDLRGREIGFGDMLVHFALLPFRARRVSGNNGRRPSRARDERPDQPRENARISHGICPVPSPA